VMGKGSGIDSVKWALSKNGVQATEEEATKLLAAVKEFSLARKRLLTEKEFLDLAAAHVPVKVGSAR